MSLDTKKLLDDAAVRSGRSQSQEAEARLEQSFQEEKRFPEILSRVYGRQLAGLLMLMGEVLRDAGRGMGFSSTFTLEGTQDWMNLPYPFDQATEAVRLMLEAIRPEGDPVPPKALEGLDSKLGGVSHHMGQGFTIPYLDAIANNNRALTSHIGAVADEVRVLLGPAADRIRKNLERLRDQASEEAAQ